MSIETEHNGHAITYREEYNTWTCFQLDLEANSLAGLKQKINTHDSEMRRVEKVTAWRIDHWDGMKKVIVTLIVDDKECWIATKKKRERVKFDALAPDTEEVRAALAEWMKAKEATSAARQHEEEKLTAIPRMTRSYLAELKVSKAEADT